MSRVLVTLPKDLPAIDYKVAAKMITDEFGWPAQVDPRVGDVDVIAALDVVLSLARTCNYPHPDRDESLRVVQELRAKIRETIR